MANPRIKLVDRVGKRLYKRPCPECGGWNLRAQTPVDIEIDTSDARKALAQYLESMKSGASPLKGPCYIMCFDCFHKGPSVDCSGRTAQDVAQDKEVYSEMKRLWLEQ